MRQLIKTPLLVALFAAFSFTACEMPTSVESEFDDEVTAETVAYENAELTYVLTSELDLTAAASSEVEANIATVNTVNRDRAWKWQLARRLQTVLNDEQKQRLFNLTERFEEKDIFGLVCFVGPGGIIGPDWRYRADFKNRIHILRLISDQLTAEQIEQIRSIETRYHSAVKALIASVKAGELTRQEFRDELASLVEATIAEIRALLTDEQIAALEAILSERKESFEELVAASKRAMYSALDASEGQIVDVENLCDRLTLSKNALFAQFAAGELNREELKDGLNGLNEIEAEELVQVLDRTQMEIVLIHKALTLRARRINMRRHRDRVSDQLNGGDGGQLFGDTDFRG